VARGQPLAGAMIEVRVGTLSEGISEGRIMLDVVYVAVCCSSS